MAGRRGGCAGACWCGGAAWQGTPSSGCAATLRRLSQVLTPRSHTAPLSLPPTADEWKLEFEAKRAAEERAAAAAEKAAGSAGGSGAGAGASADAEMADAAGSSASGSGAGAANDSAAAAAALAGAAGAAANGVAGGSKDGGKDKDGKRRKGAEELACDILVHFAHTVRAFDQVGGWMAGWVLMACTVSQLRQRRARCSRCNRCRARMDRVRTLNSHATRPPAPALLPTQQAVAKAIHVPVRRREDPRDQGGAPSMAMRAAAVNLAVVLRRNFDFQVSTAFFLLLMSQLVASLVGCACASTRR